MKRHGHWLLLFAQILVTAPAQAEIHKCRQGERVTYQSNPCPTGSLALPPPARPAVPSAFAVEEARIRAKQDIGAADALRKRDAKAASAKTKQRAEARKQEHVCTRLFDRIKNKEAQAELTLKQKKALKREQRQYHRQCGSL